MAKEDFCFTYYDGDAARDKAHMNRLERGAYDDLISAQRKRGHLSFEDIKKVLSGDFEKCWSSMEWILLKDESGKFYIEWVDKSLEKMRRQSEKQKNNVSKRWNKDTNDIPNEYDGKGLVMPLEDENGNEDEKENELKGVQGENELPTAYLMQQDFLDQNPHYPSTPSRDMPAILDIGIFIHHQGGGKRNELHEIDIGERQSLLTEWRKWGKWYRSNGNNKSLDWIVKFKLQEIYSELKNGKNGTTQGYRKTVTAEPKTDLDYATGL